MPSVPVISARECVRGLERAGFHIDRQRGSHIIMIRNEPYARVSVPNHNPIKRGTLRSIIRQADMTVDEFMSLLK